MTAPVDLDAIEARAAAATEGPWTSDDGNVFSGPLSDERDAIIMRRLAGEDIPHPDRAGGYESAPLGYVCGAMQCQPNTDADENFIREARTDVPAMAREIRELRAEVSATAARADDQRNRAKEAEAALEKAQAECAAKDELIAKLRAEIDCNLSQRTQLIADNSFALEKARAEVGALREALVWYRDEAQFALGDKSERARAALAKGGV